MRMPVWVEEERGVWSSKDVGRWEVEVGVYVHIR